MIFKTLSPYRLKTKALSINETFQASNGLSFSVLISTESSRISQFYVLESNWDKNNTTTKKIIPLAHIQVSNTTGSLNVISFQPENWNISNDCRELTSFIKGIFPQYMNREYLKENVSMKYVT